MMNSKIQKAENGKNAGSAKKSVQTGKKVADKKEANKKQAVQVAVFENPEFGTVRTTIDEKGEPWFCAKDLCDVLGYKNSSCAVNQHVRSSDVAKRYVARLAKNRFGVCEGKMQVVQMIFVNESGFYALVLGSKLTTAVKFKDWVTSVVLPQIRKTGGYIPVKEGESEEETIRNAEEILRATLKKKEELLEQQRKLIEEQKARLDGQKAWIADQDARLIQQKALLHQQEVQMGLDKKLIGEQDEEIRRLNGVVDEQVVNIARKGENIIHLEHQVDGLMPKAIYSDNVLDSVSCFTTTQVAKELGITAQELNRSLCALHIQYYQSGQYMLYAEYAHMGLAKSRTRYNAFLDPKCDGRKEKMGKAVTHTYLVWTEKGRKFIHDLAHRFWELAELFEVKNLG
ncbi:BRO family protein [Segatella copri]|uniref:BRO family protein n=1 Tax=Segatella copri TaxID=165179 RepID=UPI003F9AE6D3